MVLEQAHWTRQNGWSGIGDKNLLDSAGLVLVFGSREELAIAERFNEVRAAYPNARIISCSTSGEILGANVWDNSITSTAIVFDDTPLTVATLNIAEHPSSYDAGQVLVGKLLRDDLLHVFVISDGQKVNGSDLVRGMIALLPPNISVTGGLAGDGTQFQKTLVGMDQSPTEGNIVAIGFYGTRLKIGYGSMGGWDSFGPDRVITRAEGNVLYELDGQSALALYKKYLGDLAAELPGSALLFPLSIRVGEGDISVVRTILSIDEESESMTFAGDMPVGAYARLMKANFDRLIDGASIAANETQETIGSSTSPDMAILISCVGRKVVLGQRTEEEVESVCEVLGDGTVVTGFYSYGEISPFSASTKCELHNQTMTITTFSEK
ncbi:MAG: FIST N-terminal domain-containing protein [Candidatus Kapaibacterium sp.]